MRPKILRKSPYAATGRGSHILIQYHGSTSKSKHSKGKQPKKKKRRKTKKKKSKKKKTKS